MKFPRLPVMLFAAVFTVPPLPIRAADPAPAPVAVVRADHADGLYRKGETVTWTVEVPDPANRAALAAVPYTVALDGAGQAAKGTLDLTSGTATISATRNDPGALLARIGPFPGAKAPQALGGAVFSPEEIGPSIPAPADFDAFWQAKLADLAQVPMNPVVEKADGVPNSDGIEYDKVTLDNIWDTKVRGQLARPVKGEKFPAMLIVQWAGVYPLNKETVLNHAREGWLVLNIMAHDLPIDEPAAFYDDQKDHALKDYIKFGNEDRETSYFLRMFLGCVRAADYLASRPDWDGRILVVTGTSQGGLQSFVTAGLCPKVTGLVVLVPAGCDVSGPLANPPRAISWPGWFSPYPGRDMEKVKRTAPYFDAIYFAQRAKCPGLVAGGLIDETSRPAGVLAAYNALSAPGKEYLPLPQSNHMGANNSQAAYYPRFHAWLDALAKGTVPPPPAKP